MADKTKVTARQMVAEALFSALELRGNTWFSIIGVAVGIAAVITTLGVASSARSNVLLGLSSAEARTVVVRAAPSAPDALTWDAIENVAAQGSVDVVGGVARVDVGEATAALMSPTITSVEGQPLPVLAISESLLQACHCEVVQGRSFTEKEWAGDEPAVLVGEQAALQLGLTRVAEGRALFIGQDAFRVAGVVSGGYGQSGVTGGVLIPATSAHVLGREGPVEALVILSRPGAAMDAANAAALALDPNRTGAVSASAPADQERIKQQVMGDIDVLYVILGAVSMLVGAVGIVNTRLMAVFARSGEIGLRRALGATRHQVLAQFCLEASLLGLAGGMLGASFSVLAVVVVAIANGWPPVLNPLLPVLGPVVGLVIGSLAGLYPATRAALIEPVDALRGGL